MKKAKELGAVAAFVSLMCVLLIYVFEVPPIYTVYVIIGALVGGLIYGFYRSYFNPPLWLFKNRYWIDGLGYGVFLGGILGFTQGVDFDFALVLSAIVIGILMKGAYKYWKFNRLKKKFSEGGTITVYDRGLCYDAENNKFNGWFFMENNQFCFYDTKNKTVLFRKDSTHLSPEIDHKNYLNMPSGFRIQEGQLKIVVRFPQFWMGFLGPKTARSFTEA